MNVTEAIIVSSILSLFCFALGVSVGTSINTYTYLHTKDFVLTCDSIAIANDTCICTLKKDVSSTFKIPTNQVLNIKH